MCAVFYQFGGCTIILSKELLKNIMQIILFVLLDIANFYVEGDFFLYLFVPPPVPEKLASP